VARSGTAGGPLGANALEAHQSHQPLGTLAVDAESLADLAGAEEGPLDVQAVDLPHQRQVLR